MLLPIADKLEDILETKAIWLPDTLFSGVRSVICGTAAGNRSAETTNYYAGQGNQFSAVLYEIGITTYKLEPSKFRSLNEFGLGWTDLAKTSAGTDIQIDCGAFNVLKFISDMN